MKDPQTPSSPLSAAGASTPQRFYYGWVITGVMATAGMLSIAMGTLNFGLFIKPMGDELDIGRSAFGWAMTARQVAMAVTAPVLGWLIDRFGSRVLLAVAAALAAAAMVGMSFATASWQVIALAAVMGLVGMGGPVTLVTSVPVAKWFVRKRARAMAIMSMGGPIGGIIFMPLTQVFIDTLGWRHTWIVLAAIGASIIIPLSLLLVRRQPEDMGLLPDGAPPATGEHRPAGAHHKPRKDQGAADEVSWTVAEAMRSPRFWQLVFAFAVVSLGMSTAGLHRIPHFMDRGIDARAVSFAVSVEAAMAGTITLLMGLLPHRIAPRILGAVCFVLLGLALLFTIIASNAPMVFLSTGTFGLGIGGQILLQNYLWPDYFGRHSVGRIRGVVMPITVLFGSIGAPLAGYIRDTSGTYDPIWWAGVGIIFTAALVMFMTLPPKKKAVVAGAVPVATTPTNTQGDR